MSYVTDSLIPTLLYWLARSTDHPPPVDVVHGVTVTFPVGTDYTLVSMQPQMLICHFCNSSRALLYQFLLFSSLPCTGIRAKKILATKYSSRPAFTQRLSASSDFWFFSPSCIGFSSQP